MVVLIHNKQNAYTGYLGNRLFQYASTIGLAKKLGFDYAFPPHEYLHNFEDFERKFNVLEHVATIPTMEWVEPHFHYDDIELDTKYNWNINGYLQSYKYFEHCEDFIRDLFTFRPTIRGAVEFKYKWLLEKKYTTVALHLRRGDYTTLPDHHPVMTLEYYKEAAALVMDKLKRPLTFVVFSDDIEWCRNNFTEEILGGKIIFIDGNTAAEDMYLQGLCNHGIMSNSTFSWWANWLPTQKNRIVIAPQKWFGVAYSHFDTKDLIPTNWFRI